MGKIFMRGLKGEVIEVEDSPEEITIWMVKGYIQVREPEKAGGDPRQAEYLTVDGAQGTEKV